MPDPDRFLAPAGTVTARESGAGRWLCALAVLLAAFTGLLDIGAPWENGARGSGPALNEDVFVRNFLTHGLGVTHAAPAFVFEQGGQPVCVWRWQQPPAHPLYLTGVASLLGHREWTLRLAQLLLWLPGIVALFLVVRRVATPLLAGIASVLFATTPMAGYFGPMVAHGGAVLAFGLCTTAAFLHHSEAPSLRRWLLCAALFFVTCMLDFSGHLWIAALAVAAAATAQPRRMLWHAAAMVPVSLAALSTVALHYGSFLGGAGNYLGMLAGAAREAREPAVRLSEVGEAGATILLDYGAWPLCALALFGVAVVALDPRRGRGRAAVVATALSLPGALGCLLGSRHAVEYAFVPLSMFGGLAVLAALLPAKGARMMVGRQLGPRPAGAVLLALALFAAVHGTIRTCGLVDRYGARPDAFADIAAEAADLVDGCAVALTNRSVPMRAFLPGLVFVGSVQSAGDLDAWLELGRSRGLQCDVAFLLDHDSADDGLRARLDALATPQRREHVTVYRLRL